MFNGAGAGNSCSISRRPSAGSSCSISSAFFDDRLADDVTALAQLYALYSDRARMFFEPMTARKVRDPTIQ